MAIGLLAAGLGQPRLTVGASPTPSTSCGSSLQSLVNAATAGATITVGACTYHETVTIGKALTIRGPATITGDSSRVHAIVVTASDVTIDGLTILDTTNPAQDGAVQAYNVNRFTFKNGRILRAAGACIAMRNGSGHQVLNSELAYCGQEGFSGSALTDSLYAGNHIHHNNPNHAYDPYWEAGAGKIGNFSARVTFDNNEVDHNGGPGLWCDIDCSDITFSNNRIYSNEQSGIFFEISTGATITGNVVWDNGWSRTPWGWGAGILVASGGGANVYNNTVAWNADGIVVLSQGRDDRPADSGTEVSVSNNVVIMSPQPTDNGPAFMLAWLDDASGVLYEPASGNHGGGNRYWSTEAESGAKRFAWAGEMTSLAEFAASPGGDGDRYLAPTELETVIREAGVPAEPAGHVVTEVISTRRLTAIVLGVGLVAAIGIGLVLIVLLRRRRAATHRIRRAVKDSPG
jgi:parallel beta-helix repeat protein